MPKPISEIFYGAAKEWADLESAASLLEETKSAVLSQLMARHGPIPVSKAEMLVKASSEWSSHVEKIVRARTDANKAKVKLEYLRMKFWESQSQAATDRLEAKL